MSQVKPLIDKYGVIFKANKNLPDNEHKIKLIEVLSELEDNNNHIIKQFPKSQLHPVKGIKQTVYRAYIDKISGWRIHLLLENSNIYLIDIIEGQKHDKVVKVIKAKKDRYTLD
jgi:intein/homing endonuclease